MGGEQPRPASAAAGSVPEQIEMLRLERLTLAWHTRQRAAGLVPAVSSRRGQAPPLAIPAATALNNYTHRESEASGGVSAPVSRESEAQRAKKKRPGAPAPRRSPSPFVLCLVSWHKACVPGGRAEPGPRSRRGLAAKLPPAWPTQAPRGSGERVRLYPGGWIVRASRGRPARNETRQSHVPFLRVGRLLSSGRPRVKRPWLLLFHVARGSVGRQQRFGV